MKHIAIKQEILNGAETNSVSGRELHKTLEVKKAFTTWITSAIDTMGAVDGEDFIKLKTSLKGSGYQWDYIVTLDLAKHIAMMSKVPKGKEIREYFIKVEKQHNERHLAELSDHKHKIHALLEYTDKMGDVVTDHDKRISNLEKNQKIEHWQQKALTDAKNKKVYELGDNDEALIRKLHSRVWGKFKTRFNIPRYNELPAFKYEDGLAWLENVTLADVV